MRIVPLAIAVCAAFLSACGNSTSQDFTSLLAPATPMSTPTLAEQVRRAQKVSPGFTDYCPDRTGRRAAQFGVDVPGGGSATGWCQTIARRGRTFDQITLEALWDARRSHMGVGVYSLTYALTRDVSLQSTPVPTLVAQHGEPPR